MNQNIESMNERELLAELVRQGRRREQTEKIKTCVLTALLMTVVIAALVCIPRILAPLRQISASMDQIESSFDEAKRVLSGFDEESIEQFKQTMQSLSETSQQARALIDTLRDSGLADLKDTIEGLNSSLGSILKFFK